jgi:uncharacterized protein (DUF1330 family)
MAKGYWISAYRAVHDPERLKAYAELAGPAVLAAGGNILARGGKVEAHEAGKDMRTVIIEFDSFEAAQAAYNSDAYQAAKEALGDAVERDFRIVEGG